MHPQTEAVNADSFLDIVASVVSIMIIMVLMSGMKIKNTPVEVPLPAEATAAKAELQKELTTEESLHGDVWKTAAEIEHLQHEAEVRKAERDTLALAVATSEHQIQEARQRLDGRSQRDFDLNRGLAEARAKLTEVERERTIVETAPAETVQVECYPTPLSHTVDGYELHFQLRHGRLAYVPLEALLGRFKTDVQKKIQRLMDNPELTDTVGPEGGFRLRYTMARHDVMADDKAVGRVGAYAQLKKWSLIPVADDMGETLDEAMAQHSQFRVALGQHRASGTTVKIGRAHV
jgi:hypothetical protein